MYQKVGGDPYMTKFVIRWFAIFLAVCGVLMLIFSFLNLYALDIIDSASHIVFVLLLLTTIINLIRAIRYTSIKSEKWPRFRFVLAMTIMLTFFFAGLLPNLLSMIINVKARTEVKAWLNQIDENAATVIIAGATIDNPEMFITDLKGVRLLLRSRARIYDQVPVEIIDGDKKLTLAISQDSGHRNRYWVYYPRYRTTTTKSIGGFFR